MGACLCVPETSSAIRDEHLSRELTKLPPVSSYIRSTPERALLEETPRTDRSTSTSTSTNGSSKLNDGLHVFARVPSLSVKLFDPDGAVLPIDELELSESDMDEACRVLRDEIMHWLRTFVSDTSETASPRSGSDPEEDCDTEQLGSRRPSSPHQSIVRRIMFTSFEVGHHGVVYAAVSRHNRCVELETFVAAGTQNNMLRDRRTVRCGIVLLRSLDGYMRQRKRYKRYGIDELGVTGAFLSMEGAYKQMIHLCEESRFSSVKERPFSFRCKF